MVGINPEKEHNYAQVTIVGMCHFLSIPAILNMLGLGQTQDIRFRPTDSPVTHIEISQPHPSNLISSNVGSGKHGSSNLAHLLNIILILRKRLDPTN